VNAVWPNKIAKSGTQRSPKLVAADAAQLPWQEHKEFSKVLAG